jgi:hypothetical protein
MGALRGVFANVCQTLAHVDAAGKYGFLTAAQANTAFDASLASSGLTTTSTLDLGTAADRAVIFTVIDSALGNLEKTLGFSFSEVTTQQL